MLQLPEWAETFVIPFPNVVSSLGSLKEISRPLIFQPSTMNENEESANLVPPHSFCFFICFVSRSCMDQMIFMGSFDTIPRPLKALDKQRASNVLRPSVLFLRAGTQRLLRSEEAWAQFKCRPQRGDAYSCEHQATHALKEASETEVWQRVSEHVGAASLLRWVASAWPSLAVAEVVIACSQAWAVEPYPASWLKCPHAGEFTTFSIAQLK